MVRLFKFSWWSVNSYLKLLESISQRKLSSMQSVSNVDISFPKKLGKSWQMEELVNSFSSGKVAY